MEAMDAQFVQLIQLAINGISTGAIYSLVALGLVLAYRATEVLNFAHGDLLMLAAFVAWALIEVAGLPFWAAVPPVEAARLAIESSAAVDTRLENYPSALLEAVP